MSNLIVFVIFIMGGIIAYLLHDIKSEIKIIGSKLRSNEDSLQNYQAHHILKREVKDLEDTEKRHILRYLQLVKRVESLESIVGFKRTDNKRNNF